MRTILTIFFCLVIPLKMYPQYVAGYINEFNLQGRVKQVEEFIARFNNEEDWKGRKARRNYGRQYRMKYMRTLFDHARFPLRNGRLGVTSEMFIRDVVNNGYKIHYTDSTWRAEVTCTAVVNGHTSNVMLYMHTHKTGPYEYVWIVTDVSGPLFTGNTSGSYVPAHGQSKGPLISPADHETGFISIPTIFNGHRQNVGRLFPKAIGSGRLAKFASMVQDGRIRLTSVSDVSFRFDNVPGWNFTIRRVNKKNSANTGWLITSIKQKRTLK